MGIGWSKVIYIVIWGLNITCREWFQENRNSICLWRDISFYMAADLFHPQVPGTRQWWQRRAHWSCFTKLLHPHRTRSLDLSIPLSQRTQTGHVRWTADKFSQAPKIIQDTFRWMKQSGFKGRYSNHNFVIIPSHLLRYSDHNFVIISCYLLKIIIWFLYMYCLYVYRGH